jgi:hypothetical protein
MRGSLTNAVSLIIATLAMAGPATGQPTATGGARLLSAEPDHIRVVLLGTGGGQRCSGNDWGIGTLVIAGPELLLFDCGRGVPSTLVAPADRRMPITSNHATRTVFPVTTARSRGLTPAPGTDDAGSLSAAAWPGPCPVPTDSRRRSRSPARVCD